MRIAYLITTWSGTRLVETVSYLPEGSRALIVDTSQHAWPLARAWNYGIERLLGQEGYDAVLVCNDDVVLRADTAELCYQKLTGGADPETGLEPLIVTAWNVRDHDGEVYDAEMEERLASARPHWWGGAPDYACFMVDHRYMRVVGAFDEQFVPCYFEDNDSHRRVMLAGFMASAYAPYFHYGSTTIKYDAERQQAVNNTFLQNKARYVAKWGGEPGHERWNQPYGRP